MTPNDIKTGHVGWSPDYNSSKDPNNLEGPPPTREERAAMARELNAVAPTPADKFALMFGAWKTPRTDASPTGNTSVTAEEIRNRVEQLFHTSMGISLVDWAPIGNDLLGAATRIEQLEHELAEAWELIAMYKEAKEQFPRRSERSVDIKSSGETPRTDAVLATCSQNSQEVGVADLAKMHQHAGQLEHELAEAREALRQLHDAADVYAADQSGVTDERCGLVQPVTAEDGRRLNEALVVAHTIINRL